MSESEKTDILLAGKRCLRCGHEWRPRGDGEPVCCPNCKSPYWNRPLQKRAHKDGDAE